MDRSENHRMIEVLRIKPINQGKVNTFQIAIPDSESKEIPPMRRELLRRSLMEQGCNLIPLIVRETDAYSEEEEYEVVYGADWCQVAKEIDTEYLWVWVFDMTDEEVAIAKAEMEQLALPDGDFSSVSNESHVDTSQVEKFLQKIDVSLQKKVDALTKKVDQAAKNNEEILKKQVKGLTTPKSDTDKVEQLKGLLEKLEERFTAKVDTLAKTVEQSAKQTPSTNFEEVKIPAMLKQLDELDKLIEKKLARTLQLINQYVAESIKSIEDDLSTQITALRTELSTTPASSKSIKATKVEEKITKVEPVKAKVEPEPEPAPIPVKAAKTTTTSKTTALPAKATKVTATPLPAKVSKATTTTKAAAAATTPTKPASATTAKSTTTKGKIVATPITKSTVSAKAAAKPAKSTVSAKSNERLSASKTTKSSSSKSSKAASTLDDYDTLSLRKLKQLGKDRKLPRYARMKKPEIVAALRKIDGN